MPDSPYQEHVLHARDVCANCFLLVRERVQRLTRDGLQRGYEERLTRHEQHTTIEYAEAESVSEQPGIFCRCGVEKPYVKHRNWQDHFCPECERSWFKNLLVNCIQTLEHKQVSFDRDIFVETALLTWDQTADPDDSFSRALNAALATEASSADKVPA